MFGISTYFSRGSVIPSSWLNDVNQITYGIGGDYGTEFVGFDGGTLTAYYRSKSNRVVDSMAALRTLDKTRFTRAFATGYYAAGDGGGGPYYYDASDTTSADNGGTVIVASDGGRWKSVENGAIHATRFGVLGNGADCSTQLAAAVAYLTSLGGGKLTLPRGDILIGTRVQVNCSGIAIEGAGAAITGTRIINGQTNLPAIQFGDGVTQYGRCRITGVLFAQKAGVTPVAGNCGLKATKQLDFTFDNTDVAPYPSALYDGIRVEDSVFVWGGNNRIDSCLSEGVVVLRCTDVHLMAGRSDANGLNGWGFYGSQGVYAFGLTGFNNTNDAFKIADDGGTHSFNMFFTNCVGDTSGNHNWNISNLSVAEFTACWGSTQKSTAVNTSADGFVFSGASTRDIELNGCVALSNNAHGLQLLAGTRIKIRGGQYGNTTSGNGKSGPSDGINIQPGVSDVSISAQCCGNSQYGVAISSGATSVKVNGGEYTGNSVGTIGGITNAQYVKNAGGVNPVMYAISGAPALPASGIAATNNTGVDAMVYIRGGTVTAVTLAGTQVSSTTETQVLVPVGQTIAVTYSVAPTWVWVGL